VLASKGVVVELKRRVRRAWLDAFRVGLQSLVASMPMYNVT
jgi:hypothetical protein